MELSRRTYYTPFDIFLQKILSRSQLCPDAFLSKGLERSKRPEGSKFISEGILYEVEHKVIDYCGAIVRKRFVDVDIKSLYTETLPLLSERVVNGRNFYQDEYLIEDQYISEILVTVIASSLLSSEISYNFMAVYGIETEIKSENLVSYSIYMEKLSEYSKHTKHEGDIIQVLHAIYTYQKHYKLQHNDLSRKNILVRTLDEASTFRGQILHDADYFRYVVNTVDEGPYATEQIELYVPNKGYVLCIADFGISSTWKDTIITEEYCYETGYPRWDDKPGRCLPKGYSPVYDLLLFLDSIVCIEPLELSAKLLRLMGTFYQDPRYFRFDDDNTPGRPKLSKLKHLPHCTAMHLLSNATVLKKYRQIPPSGAKIVTLGD
jgi:hypothetical protein